MNALDLPTILSARSKTLAEIETVTAKLREKVLHLEALARLEGWNGDESDSAFSPLKPGDQEKPFLAADYIYEAKLWVETLTAPTCTTTDFVEWLELKYPDYRPNRNNIGSTFRHLKSIGKLVEEVPGSGRRPAIFRVVKNTQPPPEPPIEEW
jgi:hypothetical protein